MKLQDEIVVRVGSRVATDVVGLGVSYDLKTKGF